MNPSPPPPGRSEDPIDVQARMDAFFGIVDLCREVAVGAMISQGLTRDQGEAEWLRLRRESFLRRERPAFSRRFPQAGLWTSR